MKQEWLNFMREQYPVGSRIRLREMKDPYHPVEPGSMGTLTGIDDIGTFHVKWDNGRGLGLVMGEDSFTILPPETQQLKLYMPMNVEYCQRNEWGSFDDYLSELSDNEAVNYADQIAIAIKREHRAEEGVQGLMKYYSDNEAVARKVQSLHFDVESRDGRLWAVAKCNVAGELTREEMSALKGFISGQASDGFGESFEQHEIKVSSDMELYAHMWSSNCDWSIQTEHELFESQQMNQSPEMGGMSFA